MEKFFLGIELGSTRIKSVLTNEKFEPVAIGGHVWENRLEGGIWTYNLDDVWAGIRDSYANLAADYKKRLGGDMTTVCAMGISAMMHGYLPLDKRGEALTEFRTWRNTNTKDAAFKLSEMFNFNIPLRWSIAHLYQAILGGESHVKDISLITTLAGYVHFKLTGEKVLGVGDASGMFPIDTDLGVSKSGEFSYNCIMVKTFDSLDTPLDGSLANILPRVLNAGMEAGKLTEEGAKLLDPTGGLKPGIRFCPPEGDAGTGMAATNSVEAKTGNVSAGTSVFAMLVLEKSLKERHPVIDMVTTPDGKPVAMVHCNNGSSDVDAWVNLFAETFEILNPGKNANKSDVYERLFNEALKADADAGGLMAINYLSGEHNTGFAEGRPLFVRKPDAKLTMANFMRTMLYSSIATLKLGIDVLTVYEGVKLTKLYGHGGFFAVKGPGQKLMASALNVPVAVMETANEGGAWGIALLAGFMDSGQKALSEFLEQRVFEGNTGKVEMPNPADVEGFKVFMERFKKGLLIERAAVDNF